MKKLFALLLAVCMVLSLVACGTDSEANTEPEKTPSVDATEAPEVQSESAEPDTIVVMVPPIITDYVDQLNGWIEEFNELYPHLTIEVISTSWDDNVEKLTTMALSGQAPDIANIDASTMGTYVEMGVAVSLSDYMSAETLADYDEAALAYTTLDNNIYGLPLYVSIQGLGGNKAMLEAAGVDVEKVQSEGWSFDEFMTAIENGTTSDCYGFVFANAGITTSDFINIFGTSAGLSSAFTSDLKYAYTSENMHNLLTAIEQIISAGYMPNYGVEAGTRLVMLETGECMVTGKAMPLFESNVKKNNAGIADGTAVEDSVEVEYVFLPTPTMEGVTESVYGAANAFIALKNQNTTDEHLANVMLFLDFISSGERAAVTANECYLSCVCETGREAQASMELDQSEGNAIAAARAVSKVVAPPSGVTAEQSANANTMMDEVVVPKMQALIAGEITADDMFQAICDEAFALFGEDNCETGFIGG